MPVFVGAGGSSARATSGSDASGCLGASCHLKKVSSKRGCCTWVQAGSGQGEARARRRACTCAERLYQSTVFYTALCVR